MFYNEKTYTLPTLISRLKRDVEDELVALPASRCEDIIKNILINMDIPLLYNLVYVLNREEGIRLLNILETML